MAAIVPTVGVTSIASSSGATVTPTGGNDAAALTAALTVTGDTLALSSDEEGLPCRSTSS